MADASPRFQLPHILPGQAQKELFHNESLARIDVALHPAVEAAAAAAPPAAPAEGQSWIVAPGATGAWAGKDNRLASWSQGGWRFIDPQPGMLAWIKPAGLWAHWNGSAWKQGELTGSQVVVNGLKVVGARQPNIASPSGGTTIDAEARAALSAVIAALLSHGLIH